MRSSRFVSLAATAALWVGPCMADAAAFTASISKSEGKTTALVPPNATKMTPYGAALHRLILDEVRRTHVPFMLASPAIFVVVFQVDKAGQVGTVSVAYNGGVQVIDEYLVMIVRRAARQFPAPPADATAKQLLFGLPISFR